jgi:hypothetical protein
MKDNVLNIFVHVPKTAGETFKSHIEASLSPKSFVRTSFNSFEHYYNIKRKEIAFYKGKENFIDYIHSLTDREKKEIQCLGGHDSYYGIHELFKRRPKYLVFFRDPVARTISLYNYERMVFGIFSNKKSSLNLCEEKSLKRIKDNFLIDNKRPTFEEWLFNAYDKKIPFYYSMSRYLKYLGFFNDVNSEKSMLEGLTKFYFIGIQERYNEDALFLYHELGVKKFAVDTNISTPYITVNSLDSRLIKKIKELNEADIFLYNASIKENDRFKHSNIYFYMSLKKIQIKKRLFLFRQALYSSIRIFFRPLWACLKLKLKSFSLFIYLHSKILKKNKC